MTAAALSMDDQGIAIGDPGLGLAGRWFMTRRNNGKASVMAAPRSCGTVSLSTVQKALTQLRQLAPLPTLNPPCPDLAFDHADLRAIDGRLVMFICDFHSYVQAGMDRIGGGAGRPQAPPP